MSLESRRMISAGHMSPFLSLMMSPTSNCPQEISSRSPLRFNPRWNFRKHQKFSKTDVFNIILTLIIYNCDEKISVRKRKKIVKFQYYHDFALIDEFIIGRSGNVENKFFDHIYHEKEKILENHDPSDFNKNALIFWKNKFN